MTDQDKAILTVLTNNTLPINIAELLKPLNDLTSEEANIVSFQIINKMGAAIEECFNLVDHAIKTQKTNG